MKAFTRREHVTKPTSAGGKCEPQMYFPPASSLSTGLVRIHGLAGRVSPRPRKLQRGLTAVLDLPVTVKDSGLGDFPNPQTKCSPGLADTLVPKGGDRNSHLSLAKIQNASEMNSMRAGPYYPYRDEI